MFIRVLTDRVSVGPPNDADLEWIFAQLQRPDIATALGWDGPPGSEVYTGYIDETVLLLPFFRGACRVGFIMLVRPDQQCRLWSVHIAVPELKRRDGFTALASLDAMCHLIFDVRGDTGLEWFIEPDNRASQVLPKRLGYPKTGEVVRGGKTYTRYEIGREHWVARQQRIQARGRKPEFQVQPVSAEHVAHSTVMRAVRGRDPAGPSAPSMWTRFRSWVGRGGKRPARAESDR